MSTTYKGAGVSVERGNQLVKLIRTMSQRTKRSGVMGSIGGFGGLFDIGATGYKDPILVASSDGVGTKVKLAAAAGKHACVGIDLVAMSVNDILTQGAEPLFFLDYFATSSLNLADAQGVLEGITEGCLQAGCALIGGETAEMPGLYAPGEYDLAGFALGVVERGHILPQEVGFGDVMLALPSHGLHANGFSLVRKIMEDARLSLSDIAPFTGPQTSYAEALLEPTAIYVKPGLEALRTQRIKAMAHITGGGLIDNIPRVLPRGTVAELMGGTWEVAPLFQWLAHTGGVAPEEMVRTFNCGIGMILVLAAQHCAVVQDIFSAHQVRSQVVGTIVPAKDPSAEPTVSIKRLDRLFT